jgi:hypothetical protein
MRFKEFVNELAVPHLPPVSLEGAVAESLNRQLDIHLNDKILSPQIGLYKIRKVLNSYGFDLPALYEVEPEGDEVIFDLGDTDYFVYILYYLTDDGVYDFYALVTDEEGIEEIMSEDKDLEKEED